MYAYPALLKQVSNREDLLQTIELFDDDTGDPIKLDGCTTASGLAYVGSQWTVTDGAIVTTSNTALAIPVFPITSAGQSALALTVGPQLNILAGDPITIADTPTRQNYMTGYVLSYDPNTGKMICQIGMIFRFEIRRLPPYARVTGDAYVPWYDLGTQGEDTALIAATLGNGISIVDLGTLQVRIPGLIFQQLQGGTYSAALALSDGFDTRQVYIGQLPVIPGRLSPLPFSGVGTPGLSPASGLFTLAESKLAGPDKLG